MPIRGGRGRNQVIRVGKKSLNPRVAALPAIYVGLAVFSVAWYHDLSDMDCGPSKTAASDTVRTGSGGTGNDCAVQLQYHWIKFFGINSFLYGASAAAIFANARRKRR